MREPLPVFNLIADLRRKKRHVRKLPEIGIRVTQIT
jgi:hypothetical protein